MKFAELRAKWNWKPILGCSGRYVLSGADKTLAPEDLLGGETELAEFSVAKAIDIVVVGKLKDGGLISYKKSDNTYVHTLNTPEGFARKLSQLEISW